MSDIREQGIKELGQCLKKTRQMQGRTQANLAKILAISPQQIQKYELGLNRIPADVILRLARALEVPILAFFPSERSNEITDLQLTNTHLDVLQQLMSLDEAQRSLVVALVDQLTEAGFAQTSKKKPVTRAEVEQVG